MLTYRGKLVGFIMRCELHLFLEDILPTYDPEDLFTKALSHFQKEDYPKNSAVMGALIVIHKDYMNERLTDILVGKGTVEAMSYGFKSIVTISTNPISLRLVLSAGGKLLKEVDATKHGKTAKIYVLHTDYADIVKVKSKL